MAAQDQLHIRQPARAVFQHAFGDVRRVQRLNKFVSVKADASVNIYLPDVKRRTLQPIIGLDQ